MLPQSYLSVDGGVVLLKVIAIEALRLLANRVQPICPKSKAMMTYCFLLLLLDGPTFWSIALLTQFRNYGYYHY